jgi:hypothetical protein
VALASCHPPGTYNFEVVARFLEDMCAFGNDYCHSFCFFSPLLHFPFVTFADVRFYRIV